MGVCGYEVYRNDVSVFRTEVRRIYGSDLKGVELEYTDTPNTIGMKELTYEVRAFDFAGNFSKPGKCVTVKIK